MDTEQTVRMPPQKSSSQKAGILNRHRRICWAMQEEKCSLLKRGLGFYWGQRGLGRTGWREQIRMIWNRKAFRWSDTGAQASRTSASGNLKYLEDKANRLVWAKALRQKCPRHDLGKEWNRSKVLGAETREGTVDSIPVALWNDVSTLDFILSGRQPLTILISAPPPPPSRASRILGHFPMAHACGLCTCRAQFWEMPPVLSMTSSGPSQKLAEDVTFLTLHQAELRLSSLSPEHSVLGSIIDLSSWHSNGLLCACLAAPSCLPLWNEQV